jgi:cellulose synthase/poly-beta-1,6-N-acetylglucosamine synthase-like glycosyltransferase
LDEPEVSVVVATRDRPEHLRRLVDSLAEQSVDPSRFEVIVVDDASAGEPLQGAAPDGLRLRLIRHPSSLGPAAARNTGWRAAEGRLIAFTDDDCMAAPGWLEAMLAAAGPNGQAIVQGRTEPTDRSQVGPLSKTMEVSGPNGLFETCNVAYPRALLERVGGFDEQFRRACGEDVDLASRAIAAGGRPAFAPDALVRHAVHQPGLRGTLRSTTQWTDAVRALKLNPEMRAMLHQRMFWKPTHPRLLLAAAGAIVAARRRRPSIALLAAAPYLAHYAREYRGAPLTAARWLPAHLAVDACEVGTMVAGSVRHRTLML